MDGTKKSVVGDVGGIVETRAFGPVLRLYLNREGVKSIRFLSLRWFLVVDGSKRLAITSQSGEKICNVLCFNSIRKIVKPGV